MTLPDRAGSDTLVSVIVPTFQRHAYLDLTLRAIRAQTHARLEVLVVADGDDARTRDVVEQQRDARVRYLHVPHAGFPAVPRNAGLREARGALLGFCDDDDLWHPEKLAHQVPVLLDGGYGMCTTDFDFIDADGRQVERDNRCHRYHGPFDWQTFYASMGFICNAAGLFTRRVYEQVGGLHEDPRLRANEDFEYWTRILHAAPGYFIGRKLVSYRVHPGSIQRSAPYQVLRNRLLLHRRLDQVLDVPRTLYLRKVVKIAGHYAMDRFPVFESWVRRNQAKS